MATYVFGDIQGCYSPLQRLLEKLAFDPARDRLWFAGDLVSRGRESLETLRLVRTLAASGAALNVLGNHDVSLIAAAYGLFPPHKSLRALMDAPDCAELIEWLRQCPLLHHEPALQAILVHAGIPPAWDLDTAQAMAAALSIELRQPDPQHWLAEVYGDQPAHWDHCTSSIDQQRYALNAFTRMRYCQPDGSLEFQQKLNPVDVQQSHPELIPWFRFPQRRVLPGTIFFGHWSTLGYHQENDVIALDTGCVWGGKLTAIRIDIHNKENYQLACTDYERRQKR